MKVLKTKEKKKDTPFIPCCKLKRFSMRITREG